MNISKRTGKLITVKKTAASYKINGFIKTSGLSVYEATEVLQQYLSGQ